MGNRLVLEGIPFKVLKGFSFGFLRAFHWGFLGFEGKEKGCTLMLEGRTTSHRVGARPRCTLLQKQPQQAAQAAWLDGGVGRLQSSCNTCRPALCTLCCIVPYVLYLQPSIAHFLFFLQTSIVHFLTDNSSIGEAICSRAKNLQVSSPAIEEEQRRSLRRSSPRTQALPGCRAA